MNTPRTRHRAAKSPLIATAVAGAAGFATVSTLVAKHRTASFDAKVRKRFATNHPRSAKAAARVFGYSGKPWIHGPIAAAIANYVESRGSLEGSRAINLASSLSATVSKTFDWTLKHRQSPPGRHSTKEQSFPSGHTLETAAVALVSAYVLWREGVADARVAFPLAAAIPIAEGAGRMYLDRHWATDVLAGLLGGITLAAVCAVGYEGRVSARRR